MVVESQRGPIIRTGRPDQIRKIAISMIYESRTNGRAHRPRGKRVRGNERWHLENREVGGGRVVEIYGPATDASPKDDIFLSLRI